MPHLTMTPDATRDGSAAELDLRMRRQARLTAGLVATVVFLTAIAPLATDMYMPALETGTTIRPTPGK